MCEFGILVPLSAQHVYEFERNGIAKWEKSKERTERILEKKGDMKSKGNWMMSPAPRRNTGLQ